MYAENDILFTFTKNVQGAFKKTFPTVLLKMRVVRINSYIEEGIYYDYRWLVSDSLSLGYRWLSTVSDGLRRLSTINLSGRVLQKTSANDGNDNCKCADDLEYI